MQEIDGFLGHSGLRWAERSITGMRLIDACWWMTNKQAYMPLAKSKVLQKD